MKVLESEDDLRCIKPGKAYIKLLTLLNQLVEFPSINKVHD
jgi:hypothetical protein